MTEQINAVDQEARLSIFHDTKKTLLYLKADGWGWCDKDEKESGEAWHTGFATAWEAILDATEPYFDDED